MVRRRLGVAAVLGAVLLSGCSISVSNSGNEWSGSGPEFGETADSLPVDPAFAEHFSEPFYLDEADEFAPFGSDEGFDVLNSAADAGLPGDATVGDVLDETGFGFALEDLGGETDWLAIRPEAPRIPLPGGSVDAALIVEGAGFSLLRLQGRIDEVGKAQVLAALDVLIGAFDEDQLRQIRADLVSWVNPA